MTTRLRELEWCRFHYDDELWRVLLTTPRLAPSFLPGLRDGSGVTSILLYVRPSSGGTAEAYAMTASSALVVTYAPTALDTFVTTADVYDVEVQVTFTNGKIQTFPESGTLTIKTTEDLD